MTRMNRLNQIKPAVYNTVGSLYYFQFLMSHYALFRNGEIECIIFDLLLNTLRVTIFKNHVLILKISVDDSAFWKQCRYKSAGFIRSQLIRIYTNFHSHKYSESMSSVAQWGRVLDLRPRDRGFEPDQRHCVVSFSKNIDSSLLLVQPRKIHPNITDRFLIGRKESNQTKQWIHVNNETAPLDWLEIRSSYNENIHKVQ